MKAISLRKRQAAVTHKTIYSAALALFTKNGYDGVTVDDICLKARVSKGAFYLHFKGKEEIPLEEFKKTDEYLGNDLIKKIAKLDTTKDKLLAYILCTFGYIDKEIGAPMMRVMYQIQISSKKSSQVLSEKRALYTILRSIIEEAQNKKELRTDIDSNRLTNYMIRMYRGIVFDWCLDNGKFDLIEAGKRMFPLMWDGIQYK